MSSGYTVGEFTFKCVRARNRRYVLWIWWGLIREYPGKHTSILHLSRVLSCPYGRVHPWGRAGKPKTLAMNRCKIMRLVGRVFPARPQFGGVTLRLKRANQVPTGAHLGSKTNISYIPSIHANLTDCTMIHTISLLGPSRTSQICCFIPNSSS